MNLPEQHQFTTDLDTAAWPAVVDRATWQAELVHLRVREKAHTREGDAIAAALRRLGAVIGQAVQEPCMQRTMAADTSLHRRDT